MNIYKIRKVCIILLIILCLYPIVFVGAVYLFEWIDSSEVQIFSNADSPFEMSSSMGGGSLDTTSGLTSLIDTASFNVSENMIVYVDLSKGVTAFDPDCNYTGDVNSQTTINDIPLTDGGNLELYTNETYTIEINTTAVENSCNQTYLTELTLTPQ